MYKKKWTNKIAVILVLVLAIFSVGCSVNNTDTKTSNNSSSKENEENKLADNTTPQAENNETPSSETPLLTAKEVGWPTETVTILVPIKAGGNVDLKARLLAKYLKDEIGQPVVVENIAGGSGTVAAVSYLKEKPNTHKLFFGTNALIGLNPLYQDTPYSLDDFLPVASFDKSDFGLFVKKGGQFEHFEDVVKYGQNNMVKYGSSGPGTANYLIQEALYKLADIKADTVTHNNANEGMANVIANTTDITVAALSAISLDYMEEGTLTPILAFTDKPYTFAGVELPTAKNYGYDVEYSSFLFLATRAGTDDKIADFITQSIYNVFDNTEFQEEMQKLEAVTVKMSQEEIYNYLELGRNQFQTYFDLTTKK